MRRLRCKPRHCHARIHRKPGFHSQPQTPDKIAGRGQPHTVHATHSIRDHLHVLRLPLIRLSEKPCHLSERAYSGAAHDWS